MCTCCNIIPASVLLKLAQRLDISDAAKKSLIDTAKLDGEIRRIREQSLKLTKLSDRLMPTLAALSPKPAVTVYNCNNSQTLPGAPVNRPATSADAAVKRTFNMTTEVADFYQSVFGRNSIDDAGMTMMSSVHYGTGYANAFWNGFQMAYGDGDGSTFIDFTLSSDVIAHELTHGVTQHSLQLAYRNESGGLNESMSDVFGSMFRQWRGKQTVAKADWLIGSEIMGPDVTAIGVTCLRDMAKPKAAHCLAPQVDHFRDYRAGMGVHTSSGIPNLAFYKAATAIGGNSWEHAGQIWYNAMIGFGPSPNMKMKVFADRTRSVSGTLFPGNAKVAKAVDSGWKHVGL